MTKRYKHLTSEDRTRIDTLRRVGTSGKKIAENIGCHPSTISRELRRNAAPDRSYDGSLALDRSHASGCPRGDIPTRPCKHGNSDSPPRPQHASPELFIGLKTRQEQDCLSRIWLYELLQRD